VYNIQEYFLNIEIIDFACYYVINWGVMMRLKILIYQVIQMFNYLTRILCYFFIISYFLSTISNAHEISSEEDPCKNKSVRRFTAPIFPEKTNSPSFSFAVKIHQRSTVPNAPTVVLIPGGPGETSMDSDGSEFPSFLNVVYTDPRGLGCNKFPSNLTPNSDFFSTSQLASDILLAIRGLGLKNYILYGVSYGTSLATTVAYRAEMGEAPVPSAIVLSGTIGKASRIGEDLKGFNVQWDKIRSNLSPDILSKLDTLNEANTLLDYGSKDWGKLIFYGLYTGNIPGQGIPLVNWLRGLSDSATEKEYTQLKSAIAMFKKISDKKDGDLIRSMLHDKISCTELSPDVSDGIELVGGQLAGYGSNGCPGYSILSSPFDSAKLPLHSTIIYIEGDSDPATPIWQSLYHFNSESQSNRFFISIKEGGHFSWNINLAECKEEIWREVAQQTFRIPEALKKCSAPVNIKIGSLNTKENN